MKSGSGRPGSGVRRRPGLWCVVLGLSMLAAGRAQEPAAAGEPESGGADTLVVEPAGADTVVAEPVDTDTVVAEPVDADTVVTEPAGADTMAAEPAVADTAVSRRPGPQRPDTSAVGARESLRLPPDTLTVGAKRDSIPTTSGRGLNSPFWVMMRSVVVPGWGQATNHKWWKAVLVAGVEGYFISRIVHYERDRRRFEDKAEEFPDEADFYQAKAEAAGGKRRDYTWWTGLAVAISAGDAFVDAHLRYFDVEFDARDAGEDEPVVNIEVGLRIDW